MPSDFSAHRYLKDYLILKDRTDIFYGKRIGSNGYTPLVFVHGNAQNHTSFLRISRALNKLGHPTAVYDLPGHGRSQPYADGRYSMERFSETLCKVIDAAKFKKPILVGHSMGGMIALQYAVQNPDGISGLVLIGTADVDPVKANKLLPLADIVNEIIKNAYKTSKKELHGKAFQFDKVLDFCKDNHLQPGDQETIAIGLEYTVPQALEGNFDAVDSYDVRDKLHVLNVPALILRGEQDSLMTAEMTSEMGKRIKNSETITIQGCSHNFLIQRPEILEEMMVPWIAKHEEHYKPKA